MFDRRLKRLRLVIAHSTAARLPHLATASDADRRKAIQAKLREVEAKRSGQNRYRLSDALVRAGLAWTPTQFIAGSLAVGALLGVIGLQASPIVGVLGFIAGGLGAPQFVLRYKTKRRLARFVALFAEALDVIIRGVRSGLPLGECLHVIAREVADPIGGEFSMVTEGIRLGMTMEESLRRMALRVPTPEVKFFAIVIGIQQQTGGNLAETLAKLSDVLRSRKRMRDKVSAVSGEAKASATIIGSLPLVVSALLGIVSPDYIMLLFTSSTGNWILAGSGMIMSIGVMVMRTMINFDIRPNMPDFDPMIILTLLLTGGAAAAVLAFGLALIKRDHALARLKMISERRRALASESTEAARSQHRLMPKKLRKAPLDKLIAKLKLLQQDSLDELKRNMVTAGWRDPSGPAKFATATALLPLVLAVVGMLWSTAEVFQDTRLPMKLLLPLSLACVGGLLPRLLLRNAMRKRRHAITRAFPDALDLMVICVESGLSTEAAFNRVTEEMLVAAPEIAEEFGLLAAELAFLPDRRKPLENLAERTGLAPLRSLSTTLLQSEKYGTPVAVGIRVLAQEGRETRMAAAEKKAAALPAKLTVPMIVFFLPVLFGVIAGPAAIQIMEGH